MKAVGRAFVAVVPTDEVLDAIGATVGRLREHMGSVRWTARKQWHVTLQFLGNRANLDAVAGALQGLTVSAGDARLSGAGAFPSERRARVLWVGVSDGADLLANLAAEVSQRLAPLGYEPESRPFHAHLTVARLKTPADVTTAVGAITDSSLGPTWRVGDVVLFQSKTKPGGAEYTEVARVPLAG